MFRSVYDTISRWSRQPYLQCFTVLLLTAVMLNGGSLLHWYDWWNCDCSCNGDPDVSIDEGRAEWEFGDLFLSVVSPGISNTNPGDTARVDLIARNPFSDDLSVDLMAWYPDSNVDPGSIEFSYPPDNPNGPPPYYFTNVPVDAYGRAEITVSYTVPPVPIGTCIVDSLTVQNGGFGHSDYAGRQVGRHLLSQMAAPLTPSAERLLTPPAALKPDGISLPQEGPFNGVYAEPKVMVSQQDYHVWRVHLESGLIDETLTSTLCQSVVDLLQEDTTFVALRFPDLSATPPYTSPHGLPVVFHEGFLPTVNLMQYDDEGNPLAEVLTASMEYKLERLSFLVNEMPSAEGEYWLALGASSPPITCPEGLDIAAGDWGIETELWLDFGGEEGACAGCVLSVYYCYEGQELPFSSTWMARALDGDIGVTSYQGWGITCMGPHPLRLRGGGTPDPPFVLDGRHSAVISPTQTISFPHTIRNLGDDPVTVTLDHTSTLEIPWGVYAGTEDEPDLPLVPVTDPVDLAPQWDLMGRNTRHFWLIAEVPAGTQGAETLRITASDVTSPALSTWTSDLLWVGDWMTPPPPPAMLTSTPTPTVTPTPTDTPTPTPTGTLVPTATPTNTPTDAPTTTPTATVSVKVYLPVLLKHW